MKNKFKKVVAVVLAVSMIFGTSTFAFAQGEAADNSGIMFCTNVINGILNAVFMGFGALFPKDFETVEEYYAGESENFYEGMDLFLDEPDENAKWHLGFGKASMVPENLRDGSKEYYTGGYFTQKINGVFDDQGANAVALTDNSGRGTVVMVTVDGIGVCNDDVRAIRAEAERKLSEKGVKSDIAAINIGSTHCHTVIDTQGFGLEPLIKTVFQNLFSFLPFIEKTRSIDPEFHKLMIDGTSDAIVEAYLNMEAGELYYFETAGIGRSERNNNYMDDEYGYIFNKRYDMEGYQHVIACFKFVPDNAESKPTVLANLGGHPTTINRETKLLSADFPNFTEEKMNESGMNFAFIQGAQSPISINKGGVETEEILNEVDAEITADPTVEDYRNAKEIGYEFARLIIDAQKNAKKVEPVINVKMSEVTIPLEYGLMELGAVSGLLGMTTVRDKSSPSGYSIISEVGYLEIGTDIVMLTVPGELIPQLVYGNVVDKTQSYLGTDWEYDYTAELIGENKTVLVMGLCNDAIGYIVPDNDYAPFIADSLWNTEIGEKLFGKPQRHYEEMLSAGSKAGSSVMGALNELVNEVK
ncbi:MAG: hypothetical protein U0L11_08770 [Acutalibacteraceae bacterium]|nr:hypothetical protein [Acutalibacteraceae bacterium]